LNKDKVLSIRVKDSHFKELKKKADTHEKRVSGYVRKLIKNDLDPSKKTSNQVDPKLIIDYEELKIRNKELQSENKQLQNTIDNLNMVKDELVRELEFAKKGSAVLIKLFESAMKSSSVMGKLRDLLTDASGRPSQDYEIIMKTKKLVEEEL